MKDNVQLSFIMPCFNSESFVRTGIENIKKACSIADYSSYEIIAVNDGSTDDTAKILEALSEDSGEYHLSVIHQQNKGVSAARNAGLKQAKGDWIWFVDADDSLTEDSISHLSKVITSMCGGVNSVRIA
ncbi:MAG: glycosyltransferase family 2 protein [Prevotella sp.]